MLAGSLQARDSALGGSHAGSDSLLSEASASASGQHFMSKGRDDVRLAQQGDNHRVHPFQNVLQMHCFLRCLSTIRSVVDRSKHLMEARSVRVS